MKIQYSKKDKRLLFSEIAVGELFSVEGQTNIYLRLISGCVCLNKPGYLFESGFGSTRLTIRKGYLQIED
jgi:hypothetical protein